MSRTHGRRLLPVAMAVALACVPAGPSRVEGPSDGAAGEVPFRLIGPNDAAMVVAAEIGGEGPFDLVVDTGATLTCVDELVAERLGLESPPGIVGGGAGIGSAGRFRIVRLESVKVGDTVARDLLGCTLDMTQINDLPGVRVDGLLGLNFLKAFEVTLDFERQVLRLEPRP